MLKEMNRLGRACLSSAVLAMTTALGTSVALADPPGHRMDSPEELGPYAIGHTTVVVTDLTRNPDGTAPATGAGRPLYLHLWYPTGANGSGRVAYTWNNPVYNQNPSNSVYPGLPDLPALTFSGSPSLNPVAENAPLARGASAAGRHAWESGRSQEHARYPRDSASHGSSSPPWSTPATTTPLFGVLSGGFLHIPSGLIPA
jgi:hypothetical protein